LILRIYDERRKINDEWNWMKDEREKIKDEI